MALSVTCGCGAVWKAREDQAGRKFRCATCSRVLDVLAPGTVLCVNCSKPMSWVEEACPSCGEARPARVSRPAPAPAPAPAPSRRLCPEVVVVCALVGLDMLGSLPQFAVKGGAPVAAGALVVDTLMLVGLLTRSMWGWWTSLVMSLIRSAVVAWLSTALPRSTDVRHLLTGVSIAYGLMAVLLVIAYFRGSYLGGAPAPPAPRPARRLRAKT
jgi:hypothetical protein